MAQRFIDQATQQIAPVYAQQEQAIAAQVPAIQQLYQTLTQGLESSSKMQLEGGVRDITEDASRRGVLRSTLPVDARTTLTGTIGAALAEGLGKLRLQQTQDVGDINEKLGTLRIGRTNAITTLADALQAADLKEREFQLSQQKQREEALLAQRELAMKQASGGSSSSASIPQWQIQQQAIGTLSNELRKVAGKDKFVSPQAYGAARREWMSAGFSSKSFDENFGGFKNPKNKNYKYY